MRPLAGLYDHARVSINAGQVPPDRVLLDAAGGGGDTQILIQLLSVEAGLQDVEIRWKYAWQEVVADKDGTFEAGERGGTFVAGADTWAMNLAEMTNPSEPADPEDPWIGADGVDMHGVDYPAGFRLLPVGRVPDNQPIVPAWLDLISGRVTFSQPNSHDGECDVPI